MMKHPPITQERPSTRFNPPTLATSHLITIARQDAEIRALRRKVDAIEGLVNDANFRRKTVASLLVLFYAIWQVLQESKS